MSIGNRGLRTTQIADPEPDKEEYRGINCSTTSTDRQ
jgi:hypothetical protein